jgi:hypothetical protein
MKNENKPLRCPLCGSKDMTDDMAGKLEKLRRESEERTAKLDALEAYVMLNKGNEKK